MSKLKAIHAGFSLTKKLAFYIVVGTCVLGGINIVLGVIARKLGESHE